MGLTIQIRDVDDVVRNIDRLGKDDRKALDRITKRQAFQAQAKLRAHYSGRTLRSRSGKLRQSVRVAKIRGAQDRVAFEIGSNSRYAGIHEEGGTIRAKNRGGRFVVTGRKADGTLTGTISKGTMLAIPLSDARTAAGVARNDRIDQTALQLSRGRPFSTYFSPTADGAILKMAVHYGLGRVKRDDDGGRAFVAATRPRHTQSKVYALAKLQRSVKLRGRHPAERVADDVGRAWAAQMRAAIRIAIRKNGGT